MSEILQYDVITILTTLISAIASIFCFKLDRKLKAAEVKLKETEVKAQEVDVKSAEIANLSASNEEWIKLYNESQEEKKRLEVIVNNMSEKLEDAYKSKDSAWERYSDCKSESNKKDLVISELNWYRCEVNGCPYRRPPRKYGDMDFPKDAQNPIENPDPNVL